MNWSKEAQSAAIEVRAKDGSLFVALDAAAKAQFADYEEQEELRQTLEGLAEIEEEKARENPNLATQAKYLRHVLACGVVLCRKPLTAATATATATATTAPAPAPAPVPALQRASRGKLNPGDRFGRWVVLREDHYAQNHTYYLCRCDCGVERVARSDKIKALRHCDAAVETISEETTEADQNGEPILEGLNER